MKGTQMMVRMTLYVGKYKYQCYETCVWNFDFEAKHIRYVCKIYVCKHLDYKI